ncbi:MAG: hypothetical protein N2511_07975, partial [Thermodesulfovibrionales bacterium]|nr:hypothetical protein [Thermodesulfovibrionales bacterium]
MNVSVIKEGEDIFLPIIDRLIKEAVDFSKNLVVFPGKRPSYFLLKEIRDNIKTPFIPPSVFSIDEFVDYCYEKELAICDKKIDPLSGCKVLRELLREENFYSKQLESTSLFIPLGIKIYSTLEELLIEGVTKARLRQEDYLADISKEYTGKCSITGYLEKIIRLSDIYDRFYEILERQNLSTRSMRYKRVSDAELKLTGYERIIFAGFFALTDCERRIFEKLESDERVICLFQGELAKKYAFDRVYEPIKVDIEKIDIYECPDTHSEVFKVSSLLEEELKDKKGKESFLIVSPSSDSIIPLINSLNLTLNEDYNVSLGYPLDRTPLFSFIKHLFDIYKTLKDNKIYIP